MGLIQLRNITKQYGTQIILDGVSIDFHTGETAGLVGRNGAGKTTLFRLITGEATPDMGEVLISRGMEVGYLPQEPEVDNDATLQAFVGQAFANVLNMETQLHELSDQIAAKHGSADAAPLMAQYDRLLNRFETAGGYTIEQRLGEIMSGLGFDQSEYQLPMRVLSGGQKCRAALARLLLQDRPFLLLDEPTNHLDIDAVRWLERFLADHDGGAIVISHDRYLLDHLVDRVVELDRTKLCAYPGNYTNYVNTREMRRLAESRQFDKDKAFIEKERAFIAKHMAGQRTKEAQGRRTRLERRIRDGEFTLDKTTEQRSVRFHFDGAETGQGEVLRCIDLSKGYDTKTLFHSLNFHVSAGERIGITGPNGVGKSTLLKIVLEKIEADSGECLFKPPGSVGYYAQEPHALDPKKSLLETVRAAKPELSEERARTLLGAFLFRGEEVFKPVGNCSGGEQSRLRLIQLLFTAPSVMILDEPTNHLDIPSREALEDAIATFPGTIIAVSHDRYFLDRLSDRLLVMRPNDCRMFHGNYTDYITQLEENQVQARNQAEQAKREEKKQAAKTENKEPAEPKKKRVSAEFDAMSVEQIENILIQREEHLAALHAKFADPAVYQDPDALEELRDEIDIAEKAVAEVEAAWDERVEQA